MKARFTIDGSDALEKHLAQTCRNVANGIYQIIPEGQMEALFLGGGYGRGQGGVLKTDLGDKPYNDLEFYVCLRGSEFLNRRKYSPAVHQLSEQLSPQAGVDVELKISSVQKLRQFPPTMFSYDLACGHQTLIGEDPDFVKDSTLHARNIPLSEATRLLMNRCSGLLFAKERLQRKPFTTAEADFINRNHAKAQLGFGDVFLTAHHQYHWDCRERHRRITTFLPKHNLPWLDEVRGHHESGVRFKLHPQQNGVSMDYLCDRQRELTHLALKIWLWLESTRLQQMFTTAREYAFSPFNKCPETIPLRNFLINARTFGPAFLLAGNPWRYPRERLLHSLALLLWEPAAFTDINLLQHIQTQLRTDAVDFPNVVRSYENLWRNFN